MLDERVKATNSSEEEDIVLIVSVTKYDLNRGNKY